MRPQTIPSHQIEGWGDHRIKIPNGIIAFSYEDPGIQVIFENYSGTSDEALGMVKEILQNIENMTHEKGEIMEL